MVRETNRPPEDRLKTCPLQSHRLALHAHPVHLPAEPSPKWAQIAASCMRLNISCGMPELPRPNQAVRHDINKAGQSKSQNADAYYLLSSDHERYCCRLSINKAADHSLVNAS